jgi:hypothetical protein
MKLTRRLLATATTATVLAISPSAAAAADPTDTTEATLTVTGGTLNITVDTTRRSLGTTVSTADESTLSGQLGQVVVTDRRGAPKGSTWVANVTSTPFTTKGGPAIPANHVAYTTGRITKQGTATYTANNPDHLQRPTPAVTATDITGNNTATWTPTIHVTIPANLTAGTYSATITHSVL